MRRPEVHGADLADLGPEGVEGAIILDDFDGAPLRPQTVGCS
jgi:hypothetical protein